MSSPFPLLLALLSSCSEPVPVDLVDPLAWQAVPIAEDPFAELRPEDTSCDPAGIGLEEGLLEIDTALCGFATVRQPSRVEVRRGDPIDAVLYHGALNTEAAEAVALLRLGEDVIWEQVIPMPASAEVHLVEAEAPVDLEAGVPVWWHVHNHGGNSWRLTDLRVTTRR